jgi:hypothetical protein
MQGQQRIRRFRFSATAVFTIAAASALTAARNASAQPLAPSLCDPTINQFTTDVNNSFFPLEAGQQWVLVGKEGPDDLGLRITVLNGTERFYRRRDDGVPTVETVRMEETEWEDEDADGVIDAGEFVIETSINYFAQTQDGTVCYFGEDVNIFLPEGGVSHEGAWRADASGNAPGIFMPANPQEGMTFQQESAPGVAEDTATIIAVGRTVTTPAGTFTDTITVRDFNPLDGSRGRKSYARNVGLIHDGPLLLSSFSGF